MRIIPVDNRNNVE